MKSQEEKARQMAGIHIIQHILARRNNPNWKAQDNPIFIHLAKKYRENRDRNLLQQMAQILKVTQSKEEVALILMKDFNLSLQEQVEVEAFLSKV